MLHTSIASALLLCTSTCIALSTVRSRSSTACNNSPLLCDETYDKVTYLGAHDSPFVKDSSTSFSASGNQFYNSSVQLSAGVRLLTAQIQLNGDALHVCHSSCDLLDAGPLSSWLAEVREWMEASPDNVVTILLVNGASSSAATIAAQYEAAGITDSLVYVPSGASSGTSDWPTLGSMISSGQRLVNFVDYIDTTAAAPYILSEFDYIFENQYDVVSLDAFSCEVNRPTNLVGQTSTVVSQGVMPFMNHFLYQNDGFGIQQPDEGNITVTNSPSDSEVGALGYSATQCKQQWGRAPTYILVDFFNVGPAIQTVDSLNGVSDPVGRASVSTLVLTASDASGSGRILPTSWVLCFASLSVLLAFGMA